MVTITLSRRTPGDPPAQTPIALPRPRRWLDPGRPAGAFTLALAAGLVSGTSLTLLSYLVRH